MPEFLNFVGNSTLVAHNAEFDVGFIKYKCKDLGIDFKRVIEIGRASCRERV